MIDDPVSIKLKKCRICKSESLFKILDFGNLDFSGYFPISLDVATPKGIVDLVICENCGQTQLGHLFSAQTMYGDNYGYMSHLNSGMKNHLEKIASYIVNNLGDNYLKKIVDIGSNDGTLLNAISKINPKIELIGIDPTIRKFGYNYDQKIKKIPELFNESHVEEIGSGSVQLVTTLAMFYDLDDPLNFVNNIFKLLDNDGYWLIELTYGSWMKDSLAFDTICHEHAVYYELNQLIKIFTGSDFVFRDITLTDTNGKSLFILLQKSKDKLDIPVFGQYLLARENQSNNSLSSWINFGAKVDKRIDNLKLFFEGLREKEGPIKALGASTKGNIFLQVLKMNSNYVSSIGEINPYKFDRFTPGTGIKIVDENDRDFTMNANYLLVLPWHFKHSLINKYDSYLRKSGSLVFPLPELEIYRELR